MLGTNPKKSSANHLSTQTEINPKNHFGTNPPKNTQVALEVTP
jgi:hypothetical protein